MNTFCCAQCFIDDGIDSMFTASNSALELKEQKRLPNLKCVQLIALNTAAKIVKTLLFHFKMLPTKGFTFILEH